MLSEPSRPLPEWSEIPWHTEERRDEGDAETRDGTKGFVIDSGAQHTKTRGEPGPRHHEHAGDRDSRSSAIIATDGRGTRDA